MSSKLIFTDLVLRQIAKHEFVFILADFGNFIDSLRGHGSLLYRNFNDFYDAYVGVL